MVWNVLVSELRTIFDPLKCETWKCAPISVADVKNAIAQGQFDARSWQEVMSSLPPNAHRDFHIARVAYLVENPATNTGHPMFLAIAPDRIWMVDGNHRVAAAIVRGDQWIQFNIAPYDPEVIPSLLPSAVEC